MAVKYEENPHPVRVARQKQGMSIMALAILADIPVSSLNKIETGRQTRIFVDQLVRLGEILGVTHWWTLATPVNLKGSHHDDHPADQNGVRGEPAGALGAEGEAGESATE